MSRDLNAKHEVIFTGYELVEIQRALINVLEQLNDPYEERSKIEQERCERRIKECNSIFRKINDAIERDATKEATINIEFPKNTFFGKIENEQQLKELEAELNAFLNKRLKETFSPWK